MNRPSISLVATVLLTFFSISFFSCSTCTDHYEEHRPLKIKGMIIKKFRNKNHAIRTFEFKKEKKSFYYAIFYDIPGLWDHAEVGDSLIKAAGSLEYKLVKPDTVLYFYPECIPLSRIGPMENPKYRSP